jgi:hypothetical protein
VIRIDFPFEGAVLHHRLGKKEGNDLLVRVEGVATPGIPVRVNGREADRDDNRFYCTIRLADRVETIQAECEGADGRATHSVRVLWDRESRPRYRFSIDDNSFFLRDLVQRGARSLFDSFYLCILRDLHRKYGAKFVLNLFYSTPEDDFHLAEFPDRYRGEWRDNSDWLKLAWHARAEFPNRIYQYAHPATVAHDFDQVATEILRFGGEEVYSPPTVIHWAMCGADALPVLRERGVRVLSGFFRWEQGQPQVNYHLDPRRCERVRTWDTLMDFDSGIAFSNVDVICNSTPLEHIVPALAPLCENPRRAEIMDLFTHEQYFWPFYQNHVPDHADRLDAAIRFVTEKGYEPVFFHEGFLGIEEA